MTWEDTLQHRLNPDGNETWPISIKLRVDGGCFHCRSCNPNVSRVLEDIERHHSPDFRYEQHESGPELILCLAAGIAVVTLTKSLIDLLTTIIKARSEGQKKGDKCRNPVELIVRGFDKDGKIFEEKVLRMNADDIPSPTSIEKGLIDGIEKHLPPPADGDKEIPSKRARKK